MKLLPQEIEVRYIIPSLRKGLSKEFQSQGHKQKDIAALLELTPAAVSQYLKDKRGTLQFGLEVQKEIKISSKKIIKNPDALKEEMYRLTEVIKKSGAICQIHKKYDKVPAHCDLCFYHGNN
jgi:predicted transcriptional regulator